MVEGGRGVDERVSFENGLSRFENGLQHGGAQEVAWWHKRQLRSHRCLDQTGAQGGRGDAGDDDVGDDGDDDIDEDLNDDGDAGWWQGEGGGGMVDRGAKERDNESSDWRQVSTDRESHRYTKVN